ncbi:amino acid ABC transporter permease [Actinospica acidithermotolerans]|uniref:amino acid ABC transporter permease n=1 Tax=Actinospica acidithermotolerans TaxID=2828514 RepID=UPI0027DDE232|nr:amino acid ABC transporter permease [Actinospica acidithermotolerans]
MTENTTAATGPTTTDSDGYAPSAVRLDRERYRRGRRRRDGLIAIGCTVGFLVLVCVGLVSSPGWGRVHEYFLNGTEFRRYFGAILHGFWLNVQMFVGCEICILVLGLAFALVRTTTAPGLAPLRWSAMLYVDVFRGVPTLLLVFLVGFGLPALQLQGTPSSPVVLGCIALVLSYTAYVGEVFRAGLNSVHPAQRNAAKALGLSERQTLRHVILPQAVRNVVPPLLNDFISLQKDTALVAVLGPLEALRVAQINADYDFNYTPYLAAALLFILVTIPLTRYADWLQAKAVRRQWAETGGSGR